MLSKKLQDQNMDRERDIRASINRSNGAILIEQFTEIVDTCRR